MGTDRSQKLGKREFRPEDLSSFVLRSLKEDVEAHLGATVDSAVITVPAYFSDAQRHATRISGRLAGFVNVDLLNEPTAAALAFGLHQDEPETQFLVFDLGGGTFDVSVLQVFEGVMEVRATAGDNQLGGDDIDLALLDRVGRGLGLDATALADPKSQQVALARIEASKRELSQQPVSEFKLNVAGTTHVTTISRDDLEEVLGLFASRLRAPIERALRDARIEPQQLSAVVLAGGSTRIPAIRTLVARLFGRFPETSLDPDKVVACGAAIHAALLLKDSALAERVMTDVCPYSLGVEVSQYLEYSGYSPGFMSTIIDRNTIVPTSKSRTYHAVSESQETVRLRVFQGENRRVADNIHLGDLNVALPASQGGKPSVDIRFTYDASGILEVEATALLNGTPAFKPKQLVIQSSGQRLTAEEVAERLAALQELKIHPRDRLLVRTLLAKAERMYSQLLGQAREALGTILLEFEAALASQDSERIASRQRQLVIHLSQLENQYLWNEASE